MSTSRDLTRLYLGLVRDQKWFNHTEILPVEGGTFAMLDTGDKSGVARFQKLIKGSIKSLYTDNGEDIYELKASDYGDIRAMDAWKIGYEQIKVTLGEEYPVIPENFFCPVCSRPKEERYTTVEESWQKLIDDGLIDEMYSDSPDWNYEIELKEPIVIPSSRTIMGGEFNTIVMQPLSLNDMMALQKNSMAMSTEANQIFASWDAGIVEVKGLSPKDLNILKRTPDTFFTKKYLSPKSYEDIEQAMAENIKGIDATDRKVYCKYCGTEIGGYLDQTNFFSPLLPKPFTRNRI